VLDSVVATDGTLFLIASGGGIVGAIICALLVGARFTARRSKFFEGFRILQESLSTFHCG